VAGGVTSVSMRVLSSGGLDFEFVPVCVDGEGPFPFILDTGASRSTIDASLAHVLGLPVDGPSGVASGANCATTFEPTTVHSWSLGSLPLAPQVLPSIRIPLFGATDAPAGLLGSDVLSEFGAVRLDFRRQTLVLVGPERSPPTGPEGPPPQGFAPRPFDPADVSPSLLRGDRYHAVPMLVEGIPGSAVQLRVEVRIRGARRPFILDTGAGRTSVTRATIAQTSMRPLRVRVVVVSIGCTSTVRLVQSGAWSLGPVALPSQPMLEVSLGEIPASGLLGSDRLGRFGWIVVDYQDGELLFG